MVDWATEGKVNSGQIGTKAYLRWSNSETSKERWTTTALPTERMEKGDLVAEIVLRLVSSSSDEGSLSRLCAAKEMQCSKTTRSTKKGVVGCGRE